MSAAAFVSTPSGEVRESRLRDELLVHVDFEALDAAFVAVAASP